jgi:hypothetical protein
LCLTTISFTISRSPLMAALSNSSIPS